MNGLRRRLLQAPSELLDLWRPLEEDFLFFPRVFKRVKLPEDLAPELAEWYRLRSFYLQQPLPDFELLKSPRLAEEIAGAFRRLKPLYRYLDSIPPEEDTKDA